MSFYFITSSQPPFASCYGDAEGTPALTIDERRQLAVEMGNRKAGFIPVCMGHAGGEFAEDAVKFDVPGDKQIGRMLDAFVMPDGNLLNSIEIFHEYPEIAKMLKDDMVSKRKKWGASLGVDVYTDAEGKKIVGKKISHIGITDDPQYGNADQNATWIHLAAETPAAFYRELKKQVLDKHPGIYMPEETRARVNRMIPPEPQLIQLGATRTLGQSDPPHPLMPSLPASLFSTPAVAATMASTASDPMQGVTTTQTPPSSNTPAAAGAATTQADPSEENARYARFQQRFKSFLGDIWPEGADKETNVLTDLTYETARELHRDLSELSVGKGLADLPASAPEAFSILDKYLGFAHDKVIKFATEILPEKPDLVKVLRAGMDLRDRKKEAAMVPTTNNLPMQTFIAMANALDKKKLNNFEDFRVKFETQYKAEEELKKANADLQTTNESLKRAREEADTELAQKKARLEVLEKLSTLAETSKPAASSSSNNSLLMAAASVPGATAAGATVISAGASRDTSAMPSSTPARKQAPPLHGSGSKFFDPSPMGELQHTHLMRDMSRSSDPLAMQKRFR
jgi:hypothetical protein